MSANDILPTLDELIGPGKEALVAKRPAAFRWVNTDHAGTYGNLFTGWRAQAALALARLSDEVVQSRRPLASGDGLKALARSEYKTIAQPTPTQAVGSIFLSRVATTLQGVIRKGTRFRRIQDDNAQPLKVPGAVYTATKDIVVVVGQAVVTVPIIAQATGRSGNHTILPDIDSTGDIEFADKLFDTFTCTGYEAAGGSDGTISDDLIRRLMLANVLGANAPTNDAIVAGSYATIGVSRVSTLDDPNVCASIVFATDEDWASSAAFSAKCVQSIHDGNYLGFGCKAVPGVLQNSAAVVTPIVSLKDPKNLVDTTDVDDAIRTALVAYFDNRPDWWMWRFSSIRAAIAGAHQKILTCTAVSMKNAVTNANMTEPAFPTWSGGGYNLTHIYLANQAVNASYTAPN